MFNMTEKQKLVFSFFGVVLFKILGGTIAFCLFVYLNLLFAKQFVDNKSDFFAFVSCQLGFYAIIGICYMIALEKANGVLRDRKRQEEK